MRTRQYGFSLIEISIVIVVIALVIGGIITGQSLIRASEINSIGTDAARVRQAVTMFKDKYRYLPGDMANATVVWGAVSAGCTDATSNTDDTCNGNGDGRIALVSGGAVPATGYEILRAWQHLANAGMIDGKFTGGPTVAGQALSGEIGINMPSSAISNASMQLMSFTDNIWASVHYYIMDPMKDYMIYGLFQKNSSAGGGYALRPMITPSEAESLDRKLDDGRPGTGTVMTAKADPTSFAPNCADSTATETALYNVTYKQVACPLIFSMTPSAQ